MKISIITVVYNAVETLEKSILSVISQGYSNIEYIIIDGGSTDGTIEIIEKYKSKISYFISEKDCGLYDAMNKGIKASSGEIIGILNADDTFFSSDTIQKIVEFHLLNYEMEASIGDVIHHDNDGKIIRYYSSKQWNPSKLKYGFMPPHPSLFMKKELFEKLGLYSLNFSIGADYDLIVRYFLKNQIKWKYHGIITTKMLTGGLSTSGIESYMKISKEIKRSLIENDISYKAIIINLRFLWKIFELIERRRFS
jgi:glycosyltransferase involved in cell wall biosynthesis